MNSTIPETENERQSVSGLVTNFALDSNAEEIESKIWKHETCLFISQYLVL